MLGNATASRSRNVKVTIPLPLPTERPADLCLRSYQLALYSESCCSLWPDALVSFSSLGKKELLLYVVPLHLTAMQGLTESDTRESSSCAALHHHFSDCHTRRRCASSHSGRSHTTPHFAMLTTEWELDDFAVSVQDDSSICGRLSGDHGGV